MGQNNHEVFTSLMDTSDGKGADGVQHPDLKAKSDTGDVKSAPVDTTRLKKDINKDYSAGSSLYNAANENPKAIDKFLTNLTPTGSKDLDRGADALLDRGRARSDTLDQARKGKIPATSGKNK